MAQPYSSQFFEDRRGGSRQSAAKIVPLITQAIQPRAVVDVGCGVGTWLAVFAEQGVTDTLGIDGSYVDPALLEIPRERFLAHDLTTPIRLERRFDLVLCLEVAEHLPAEHAHRLIRLLTGLAPVVIFSAAIPNQRGTHHVNEQWPEYWVAIFERHGFMAIDCLRPRLWTNDAVEWWYAQNMLLFVRPSELSRFPQIAREAELHHGRPFAIVHPKAYTSWVDECSLYKESARGMSRLAAKSLPLYHLAARSFSSTMASSRRGRCLTAEPREPFLSATVFTGGLLPMMLQPSANSSA